MKRAMMCWFVVSALSFSVQAQLLVNVQLPASGLLQKPQLWNMTVTNTGTTSLLVQVNLLLTDAATGQEVLSASTGMLPIAPGTHAWNPSTVSPVQYNVLSSTYVLDASPEGWLPVGHFTVCYQFTRLAGEVMETLANECQELVIDPLSPPQLTFPYDQTAIAEPQPQFTWLPPAPVTLFASLSYDLEIVEIYPSQSAADAMQQNIPIYIQHNLNVPTCLYPASAPALELNKNYAWRITACSNQAMVARSEVWQFTRADFQRADSLRRSELPFAKLRKNPEGGYALFTGTLKFDYLNETTDSVWKVALYDMSTAIRKAIVLTMDSIPLKQGQNLVQYEVNNHPDFIDRHLYLLEVTNSRGELYKLPFEYRVLTQQ